MEKKLKAIEASLRDKVSGNISCSIHHSSIVLDGEVDSWEKVILAGKLAANKGFKGVVNKIKIKGLEIPKIICPKIKDTYLHNKRVDVLVIGGGVIGCSIARELSKWDISILLVEKEEDLAMHTSSRNDGMIHPGIEPHPGSKRAAFNVRGNNLYPKISKELGFSFERCGSNVLFDKNFVKLAKPFIMARAKKNNVEGVTLLSKSEVKNLEPNILDDITGSIHFTSTGIVCPYKVTIAYGENAVENGAEISLNTIVLSITKENDNIISVETNRGIIYPKVVINAAGVYTDHIADMVDDQFFTIHPRKGHILILDKKVGDLLNGVIGKPSLNILKGNTKGGGLVKTIDGNILVGPDAYEQPFKEDYSTNSSNINDILEKQLPLIPKLSKGHVITYFSGTRAATYEEDFIIEKSEYVKNLVYAAGIQSPGLASAPAIAEEVEKITCDILKNLINLKPNPNWNPYRKSIPNLANMNLIERDSFIKRNPNYGVIICRCEEISKGEIIDAIHSPIPVYSVDGIKRRVRAGMGRCQGGFCMPSVMKIISEETKLPLVDITKKGGNSKILIEENQSIYIDEHLKEYVSDNGDIRGDENVTGY